MIWNFNILCLISYNLSSIYHYVLLKSYDFCHHLHITIIVGSINQLLKYFSYSSEIYVLSSPKQFVSRKKFRKTFCLFAMYQKNWRLWRSFVLGSFFFALLHKIFHCICEWLENKTAKSQFLRLFHKNFNLPVQLTGLSFLCRSGKTDWKILLPAGQVFTKVLDDIKGV